MPDSETKIGSQRQAIPALPALGGLSKVLILLAWTGSCGFAWGNYDARPVVGEYIDSLTTSHGFSRPWLVRVFAGARKNDTVIANISKPAEKVLAWHDYRDIFLTEARINAGVNFWRHHRTAVGAARQKFGVAGEMVVAIIGVETFYGRYRGKYRVIDALATLAFDYPPRAAFFKRELTEFLLLVREEGVDPFTVTGSYAGAMGYGQFIPSSYRAYAVDFDGDGHRDIWSNATDAIGSVASYFARHGWRGRGPTAIRVRLGDAAAARFANTGLDLARTVGELRGAGVTGMDGVADNEKAALFRMDAEDGVEYWLGLHDFHVITRYNRSSMYALAVLQLSDAIRQRLQTADGTGPG